MSNYTERIKTYKPVYPQIYSYILPNRKEHDGFQKIGYTESKDVDKRIKQQVRTAGIREEYDKLWSAPAFFNDEESFTDHDFHRFLIKKGIKKPEDKGVDLPREWFYFNEEHRNSKILFDSFREQGFLALQTDEGKTEYVLRDEQEDAVQKALDYFTREPDEEIEREFLWNAKPRFGKTLASYDLIKRLKASKVLIVTNRPAIANSWFDDYEKFVENYAFVSETGSLRDRPTLTREQHILQRPMKPLITFLSLQDLKGSIYFGGDYDKLQWVAELEWDILIVDETHEGVDTIRTDAAFDYIKRKYTLHLSGTPFKALTNEKFSKDAIYNWTYLDEQKAKKEELNKSEAGPHTELPDIKLFTYRISQMIRDEVNKGIEIDDETHDYAFDLNEFFSTNKSKKFVYEEEVKQFLVNLSTNEKYPFSTPALRAELKHTFWYVGNRVNSVKALARLLKQDPVFKDYEIIIAAGDGKSFEEEERDFYANETSFDRVIDAISKHDKTITLSCGQLTTGVTIKEWSAVLMLTDIKSPSLYMQAAFRAQNPHKVYKDGELVVKESAYLFDFAPTRVLEIYDQFANGLNPKAVAGEITEEEREENIEELLNFFPVISEDVDGKMVELDAKQVLTFPNALAATEIVNARFMTNLLFNDSVKGVFNFPREIEEILDKMPIERNKRTQKARGNLELDIARDAHNNKAQKIDQNKEIILGEKIRANTERVIDGFFNGTEKELPAKELAKEITEVAEPLIAKYKEVYKATKAETDEVTKQIVEKVEEIAEEYNSAEIKDRDDLKKRVIKTLEVDFVMDKVTEKEEEAVEKVSKTKEEEIRERLRSFTRTIPMFIMANDSKEEITIDNFDLEIDDDDFLDLTSITKEEFHKLRDGFDYEEDGERKTFRGVFDKYRFNASIAEFRHRKEKLSDYFTAKEDIFEFIPNQKTNQIFTPRNVVKMMIDQLEEHDPTLFTRTDSTFIDLYMKSGMYITEIVKKLFFNTQKHYQSDEACLKHILENQVYGLSPTPILQDITQVYIFGFDTDNSISRKNFIQHDITPEAKDGKVKEKLQELFNLKEDMKFDAVVGNPPYQESISSSSGNASLSKQLFPDFVKASINLKPNLLSLITPSRWFTGDAQDKSFLRLRKFLKKNNHFIKIVNFPDASLIFPNVLISGGVNYFLYSYNYNDDVQFVEVYNENNQVSTKRPLFEKGLDIILSSSRNYKLIQKIKNDNFISMTTITQGRNAFGIVGKNVNKISMSTKQKGFYELRCKHEEIRYVDKKYITKNIEIADKWKIFISKANGAAGLLTDEKMVAILGKPYLGKPLSVCTDSLIPIGSFDTEFEANSLINYIKTKFLRYTVGLLKVSQNIYQNVYEFVPLQDFTENSDIDWSKSISEIDQQLYKKYNLSNEEIAFIEEKVQPMD